MGKIVYDGFHKVEELEIDIKGNFKMWRRGKMKNKKAIAILLIGVMLITTFASVFASLL